MATVTLGKIAFAWRGLFDPNFSYAAQDVVHYNGSAYVCSVDDTQGVLPTVTAAWDLFAQGARDIASGSGELVFHDGSTLAALTPGETGQVLTISAQGLPEWSIPTVRSGTKALAIQDAEQPFMYRRGAAVMTDGTVRWWGRGENWMHGTGNQTADRSYPVSVAFPPNTPAIKYICGAHDFASVAIDANGQFWVWGQNDYGDVGRGDTADQRVPYNASGNSSNSIYGKSVIAYAPMASPQNYISHMVLCSDGTVHTCGYNGYGQLGQGDTTTRYNFVQVPMLSNIVQIARGGERYTSCYALKDDGTLYSWGYNAEGQLGSGDTTQRNIPMTLPYFANNSIVINKAGASRQYAWAIDTNNKLYTWGYNGYGNLGHSGTSNNYTPTQALTNVADCNSRCESYHRTYALRTDGTVWATGDNSYGCLGVAADATDRSSFTQCRINASTPLANITKIIQGGTGSYNYAVALDEEGICWSVGYSGNGQLGRGTYDGTNYFFAPVLIHRRRVVDIAPLGTGSEGGVLFLLDDGQVYQTGYAGEAQLPEDDSENISVPMQVIF
jgi:alpha-tubulin suppressor-like RCC1 family protein